MEILSTFALIRNVLHALQYLTNINTWGGVEQKVFITSPRLTKKQKTNYGYYKN